MSERVIGFTCVGRRVQLVRHFRQACERLGVSARFVGIDADPVRAPAAYFCDEVCQVPSGGQPGFGRAILDAISRNKIQMLVPLADPDLSPLGEICSQVRQLGCLPAYSGSRTMRITMDKLETYRFLAANGRFAPRTRILRDVLASKDEPLPLFVKPRTGSAGRNAFPIRSWSLPDWIVEQADQFVCQELLTGQEVTVDVFIDLTGRPHCAVPRIRLETRGGEVMKSQVRMDPVAIEDVCGIARALPDAFGVINVQGFIQPDGRIGWTEINARFGGGSPLSLEAGAPYADMLIAASLGQAMPSAPAICDGLTMLRFDDAVYAGDKTTRRGSDVSVHGPLVVSQSAASQPAPR